MDIWWNPIKRQVIESFIKPCMSSKLDSVGDDIIPEDIPESVRHETQEDPFSSIRFELGRSSGWRLDPHSAAKSLEPREIILVSSDNGDGTCNLVFARECI